MKVRKKHILEALEWLKKNNPDFIDIDIDHDRINKIPEEGDIAELEGCQFLNLKAETAVQQIV